MALKKRTRIKSPTSVGRAPILKLTFLSLVVAVLNSLIYKFVDGWVIPAPWILLSLAIEVTFVWALYAIRPSVRAVLAIQFLVGVTFRSVNAAKLHFLSTPLLPSDFFLIHELYRIMPLWLFLAVAGALVTPVIASGFILLRRPRGVDLRRLALAAPAGSLIVTLAFAPNFYADAFDRFLQDELYGIPFLIEERQHAIGVPLAFTIDLAKFMAAFNETYSEEDVRRASTKLHAINAASAIERIQAATPPPSLRPRNIYVFMVESFWDPTWLIEVPNSLDPDFRAKWRENGGLSLLSPTLGGGTANVEFEVLCGLPSGSVVKGIIFQVAMANEVPCVPKVLADQGYRTFAFHAFESGYFNRNVAFPSIGFEEFEGVEDFVEDASGGAFIADEDFLKVAIERARRYAEGKPFLAYFMTFAGHWPYAWLPESYKKEIALEGADQNESIALLERHLNVNRTSSVVLNKILTELRTQDPDALVIVAGDHIPALGLSGKDPDANDWRFFHTPLLVVDRFRGTESLGKFVPAYDLAVEILNRVGIPPERQGYIGRVQSPLDLVIRPEQNNATFVAPVGGREFQICTPQSSDPLCLRSLEWLSNVRVLARDIVIGGQHSLK